MVPWAAGKGAQVAVVGGCSGVGSGEASTVASGVVGSGDDSGRVISPGPASGCVGSLEGSLGVSGVVGSGDVDSLLSGARSASGVVDSAVDSVVVSVWGCCSCADSALGATLPSQEKVHTQLKTNKKNKGYLTKESLCI